MVSSADVSGSIVRLGASDADRYCEHLLRLDQAARELRFFAEVSDFHVALHAGAALADGRIVIGYVVDDEVRGACELMLSDEVTRSGEGAFSVEGCWRRHGIGSRLMVAMIDEARRSDIRRIELSCLKSNVPMQCLAAGFTDDLRIENDTVLAILERQGVSHEAAAGPVAAAHPDPATAGRPR
ncbi:GNAT family N-acetyltransferase [Blastochloris viridis]|uniref:Acetyltransferase (GNAT) family protein n=1 Tax=Blastochloris viridis TaxID=1079 RepID=A0A0H5BQ13_BLAVI|nr:GNAT family N-acetyltransferase [Blastochloris viridis]ALK09901.1 Acetyltransferase (GNAT) family protein [Blastochloris viridis]BAS00194.1 GCN5-related N-acetyltransferase [Blastochloris viridis]CUU42564.1 Acetyltransferase (GNAT) family protein [Blastochloris viridis]